MQILPVFLFCVELINSCKMMPQDKSKLFDLLNLLHALLFLSADKLVFEAKRCSLRLFFPHPFVFQFKRLSVWVFCSLLSQSYSHCAHSIAPKLYWLVLCWAWHLCVYKWKCYRRQVLLFNQLYCFLVVSLHLLHAIRFVSWSRHMKLRIQFKSHSARLSFFNLFLVPFRLKFIIFS